MKTYTKTITETKPRLIIEREGYPESPRKWSTLGLFLTKERMYMSPDGNDHILYNIMIEEAKDAKSLDDHIQCMYERIKKEKIDVVAIYPVSRYEHGNVKYYTGDYLGETSRAFDDGNCGFYFVTKAGAEELGTPPESYKTIVDEELDLYTKWANGNVYMYTLYDENGEIEDSCCGFYSIQDIRDNLPEDWQGEELLDYFIKN